MKATDGELFSAYRNGDRDAFDELLNRHASPLLGYLNRMLNDRMEAEDLFQETFKRVCLKADQYNPEKPFKPWLYRIASNLAIDQIRKRQRQPAQLSLDAPVSEEETSMTVKDKLSDPIQDPSEVLDKDDRKKLIRDAVNELPPGQRTALLLSYFHQMTYSQIAESLDCSVGTIKTHMSRAMKTLAKRFPNPEELELKQGGQS